MVRPFANFTPGPTDITASSNGNRPTTLVKVLNPMRANNGARGSDRRSKNTGG
jgi:hypothetical protein